MAAEPFGAVFTDRRGSAQVVFTGRVKSSLSCEVSSVEAARQALLLAAQANPAATGAAPNEVVVNRQVHSARVVDAARAPQQADGLASKHHDLALCVFTADCVPVLLASADTVSALHAGWRGLASGIISAWSHAVATSGPVTAWIGPSIGPCCYQVSEEVAGQVALASGADVVVTASDGSRVAPRPLLDLQRAARNQLLRVGVDDVRMLRTCTYCDSSWHSYRREGPGQGRNHAFIWRVA